MAGPGSPTWNGPQRIPPTGKSVGLERVQAPASLTRFAVVREPPLLDAPGVHVSDGSTYYRQLSRPSGIGGQLRLGRLVGRERRYKYCPRRKECDPWHQLDGERGDELPAETQCDDQRHRDRGVQQIVGNRQHSA
jgi:hypothetical protein